MGIASSDFDRDGDLDFYVTGFAREYNIYYEQISPGLWKDETSKLGLVEPTLMMVGFGTARRSIWTTTASTRSSSPTAHRRILRPEAPPYELPLQIFRRGPQGSFVLLDDDSWGDYFPDAPRRTSIVDDRRQSRRPQ